MEFGARPKSESSDSSKEVNKTASGVDLKKQAYKNMRVGVLAPCPINAPRKLGQKTHDLIRVIENHNVEYGLPNILLPVNFRPTTEDEWWSAPGNIASIKGLYNECFMECLLKWAISVGAMEGIADVVLAPRGSHRDAVLKIDMTLHSVWGKLGVQFKSSVHGRALYYYKTAQSERLQPRPCFVVNPLCEDVVILQNFVQEIVPFLKRLIKQKEEYDKKRA